MLRFGKVTRVDGVNVYVKIANFAGDTDEAELGPYPCLVTDRWTANDLTLTSSSTTASGTTGSANGPDAHTHSFSDGGHTHTVTTELREHGYKKGDRVLLAQIGHVKEHMVVIGRVMT